MEILQLKYFRKIAYLEHMTKAAQELCVSQPSLSKTIRMLEDELGVRLFDRNGKYIKLNRFGKAFLSKVDLALSALEDGKKEIECMRGDRHDQIRIAFLAASPLLTDLLSSFRSQYSNVNFLLKQHLPEYKNDDFDMCISSLPLKLEGIVSVPLLTEKFLIAVPRNHPMAQREHISLHEIANEGFIALKQGHFFRELTDRFCKIAGFTPVITFESDDPSTVRGLINAGQGIGFIPSISWGNIASSSIRLLELDDPVCERTIGLSWIENRYHTQLVQEFRRFTIDYFKNLGRNSEINGHQVFTRTLDNQEFSKQSQG